MRRPFRGEMPILLTLPLGPLGIERRRRAKTQRRRRILTLLAAVALAVAAFVINL